jgi:pyruvate dehydrogenase (quinone)
MIGLKGIFVDDPERLGEAWEEALSADRPTVVEVKTDREIAPLPPHITLAQAKRFVSSMAKDESAGHVIRDTARQIVNAVFEKAD